MIAIRILAGLLLGLSLTAPCLAQSDAIPEPGIRYRVIGVAEGDYLNVRAGAGADADLVGMLGPASDNIIVTGARQVVGGSVWWELVQPEAEFGTGWVNARFLEAETALDDEESNYPLVCSGTEPFWSLVIAPDGVLYSSADGAKHTFASSGWMAASGLRGQFMIRLQPKDAQPDTPEGVLAVLRDYNFCSDGMSDRDYPFHGTLLLPDGEVVGGCCSRGAH
jgi:uncharacterized membrane protein